MGTPPMRPVYSTRATDREGMHGPELFEATLSVLRFSWVSSYSTGAAGALVVRDGLVHSESLLVSAAAELIFGSPMIGLGKIKW
jgi:hypothetical protein